MTNLREARSYRINIQYGNSDLDQIFDQLATQTVQKSASNFYSSNSRVKKNQFLRRAL